MPSVSQIWGGFASRVMTQQVQVNKFDFEAYVGMCVHRDIDPDSHFCLTQLMFNPSIRFIWGRVIRDGLIDRARSIAASKFLFKSNAEVYFSVDDDVIYDPLDAIKICRMVQSGEYDILGGAYVAKQDGARNIIAKPFKGQTIRFAQDSEPVEVRMVSTGFVAIHRKVFEKLTETVPLCHSGNKDFKFYPFFQPFPKEIDGEYKYLGEDWAFMERARDLGFKVWLDPAIWLAHSGRYKYDLDDFSREKKKHFDVVNYTDPN